MFDSRSFRGRSAHGFAAWRALLAVLLVNALIVVNARAQDVPIDLSGIFHPGEPGQVAWRAIKPTPWNGTLVLDLDFAPGGYAEAQRTWFLQRGYAIGGIPPIGHVRPVRVIMDPDLGRFPVVWAAAGTDRAVFPVPPGTLRSLANAMVAPITEDRQAVEPGVEAADGSFGGPAPANAGA